MAMRWTDTRQQDVLETGLCRNLHLLLTWFSPTFALGHWISQRVDATADSLIFVARKPDEGLAWNR